MGAGAAAADRLVAEREARLALAAAGDARVPPTLTLVATADGQPCARCSKATARRPAYWGEWLCPRCARLTAADFDRAGRWPEVAGTVADPLATRVPGNCVPAPSSPAPRAEDPPNRTGPRSAPDLSRPSPPERPHA